MALSWSKLKFRVVTSHSFVENYTFLGPFSEFLAGEISIHTLILDSDRIFLQENVL